MTTHKPLGQVAFEAYRDTYGAVAFDGKPIPAWDDLEGNAEATRAAWQMAALAAVSANYVDQADAPIDAGSDESVKTDT